MDNQVKRWTVDLEQQVESVSETVVRKMRQTMVMPASNPAPMFGDQAGHPPWMWSMSLDDIKKVRNCEGYKKDFTMRDVVEAIVKPRTKGKAMSYALVENMAAPLRARVVVSHCWDEPYEDFVEVVDNCGLDGPFWICSFALYQHFQTEILSDSLSFEAQYFGQEAMTGSFRFVLQQAEALLMVFTKDGNPMSRLFCRAEFACAKVLSKPVKLSSVTKFKMVNADAQLYDPLMDVPDALINDDAQCGRPGDKKSSDDDNQSSLEKHLAYYPQLRSEMMNEVHKALSHHVVPATMFLKDVLSSPNFTVDMYIRFLQDRDQLVQKLKKALN
jgi:hypothetical protein